jgi:hypothetical protein
METRHPGALDGTNSPVLGVAMNTGAPAATVPRAMGSARVQVNVVVVSGPDTRNSPEGGSVRHAKGAATVPISMDQRPPGVRGCSAGKPRTANASHGPGSHVAFVTRRVMGPSGAVDEEHAIANRSGPRRKPEPGRGQVGHRRVSRNVVMDRVDDGEDQAKDVAEETSGAGGV